MLSPTVRGNLSADMYIIDRMLMLNTSKVTKMDLFLPGIFREIQANRSVDVPLNVADLPFDSALEDHTIVSWRHECLMRVIRASN